MEIIVFSFLAYTISSFAIFVNVIVFMCIKPYSLRKNE